MTHNQLAIRCWVMFTFNYSDPREFINYMCEKTQKQWLKGHLEEKFNAIYDKWGHSAVMNRFYSELDAELRDALVEYAMTIYAPEGMRLTEEEEALLEI